MQSEYVLGGNSVSTVRDAVVAHILPRRWFTDPAEADDPTNLLSSCASCDARKTTRAERKLLQGDLIYIFFLTPLMVRPESVTIQ